MTVGRTLLAFTILILLPSRALAQPAAATLIAPAADVVGSTITFTWQSAPDATWYHFWLGKTDSSPVTEQWYTAEHAGCATGGTCAVTLAPPIGAGAFLWYIRTWNASGYGPWSFAHMFTMRDVVPAWSSTLPASRRFTLVLGNQAVLDNETGLVWERQPAAAAVIWNSTTSVCLGATTGNRLGWRVPTIAEARTLFEVTANGQALPSGHPFIGLSGGVATFWTTSLTPAGDYRYVLNSNGSPGISATGAAATFRVWCVRGGAGL